MTDVPNAQGTLGERLAAISALLLIFVVLPSTPLQALVSVDVKRVFQLVVLCLLVYLMLKNVRVSCRLQTVIKVTAFGLLALLASLFSNSTSQLLLGVVCLVMVSLTSPVARLAYTRHAVNFMFRFAVVLLVGAWIGFFYALLGGGPLACVVNPDGRDSCLFLTTFTNTSSLEFWGLIRPSGVFDEPGALSFFTIMMVCLNELSGGSKKRSLLLFSLGLVTLSLGHFLCMIAYSMIRFKKWAVYIVTAFVLLIALAQLYVPDESLLYLNLISRLAISKDEGLKGDNRSGQVKEFFSLLDKNISRYGENVMVKRTGAQSEAFDQSSNPFSIWFGYGFLMWLPYAGTLLTLCWHFFSRNQAVRVTSVLMVLMLLQRPYIYSMYWGFAIWGVVTVMFLGEKAPPGGALRQPGQWAPDATSSPINEV
jgi:hypothetical protein